MRIVPLAMIYAASVTLATGCETAPTAIPDDIASATASSPRPVPDISSRAQLVATIDHLQLVAGDPRRRAHAWFGTTSSQNASVEKVLAELQGALAWMDADDRWTPRLAPASPTQYASYASPQPGGSSWIEVTGTPGTLRYVYYKAYTVCINCSITDLPKGQIRARQYAGPVLTLSIDRTFSGGQGYCTGEVTTTLTGDAQTGTISTDHWIDVWLGNDPHYYSSATAQV